MEFILPLGVGEAIGMVEGSKLKLSLGTDSEQPRKDHISCDKDPRRWFGGAFSPRLCLPMAAHVKLVLFFLSRSLHHDGYFPLASVKG